MLFARPGPKVRPAPPATAGAATRRLDWRLLLPGPPGLPVGSLLLLSDDPGLAAQVTESGVATDVRLGACSEGPVDAVVSLDGDPTDVATALERLRPGGVLYCEVDRTRASWWPVSPARLRRTLGAAGVRTTAYWRTRRGEHDTLFLPLDVPGAAPWYLRELMDGRKVWRRLARRALSAWVGQNGQRLAVVAPRYSILGVMASAPAGRGASRALGPDVLGVAADDPPLPVILARGEGAWSRVVLLPFGHADLTPREVVKLPRAAVHNTATEHEQGVLRALRDILPAEVAATVPTPLGVRTWQRLSVGRESFLPGRPLALLKATPPGGGGATLTGAVDWLIAFHAATRGAHEPLSLPGLAHEVDRLLGVLGVGLDPAGARQLWGAGGVQVRVPTVWQHGDLTPTNIRWDGQRYTVVDWESARPGPALSDLFYLLLHWGWDDLPPLGAEPEKVFGALYLTADGEPAVTARDQVRRYCAALGVDLRCVPLLLVAMLCQQALDRVERVRDSGGDPRTDDNLYARLAHLVVTAPQAVPVWGPP